MKYIFASCLLVGMFVTVQSHAQTAVPTVIELSISQHTLLSNKMTDSRADKILALASKIITDANSDTDTACPVEFKRNGSIKMLSGSQLPFEINSRDDFAKIKTADNAVKIVASIGWCGKLLAGAIGCADVGGPKMAVIRISGLVEEAILWAHEYGHTSGSGHRDILRQLMRPSLRSDMQEVSAAECDRLRTNFSMSTVGALVPAGGPTVLRLPENNGSVTPVSDDGSDISVEAFVSSTFFEGVPYVQAAQFDESAIPKLVEILEDETQSDKWINVVSTLGAIGSEQSEQILMEFLSADPDAEVSASVYLAKSNVPVALGWLVARSNSESALRTLINATNSDWWAEELQVNWRTPIHEDQEALIKSLVTKAIIGLTLSGTDEARIRLSQLEAQLDPNAPRALLNEDESLVFERLGSDGPALTSVSPMTRRAVNAGGGKSFLFSQMDEFSKIREQGLLEYYK